MKIFILSFILLYQAFAMTGLEVMQKVESKSQGFEGSEAKMKMTLIDAHGTQVERVMEASILENVKEGDKSITAFLKPTDIKGTKLLTWTRVDEDNKQWLYLPKFKRVKKINSKNQAGSFMGSEFSYEDIGGQVLDKYNYKILSEDKENWMIESTPKKKSGYSKLVTKISKTDLVPLEVKYFDRRGELLKESTISDFKTYKVGKKSFLMSNKIEMKNVQTQKKSIITWDDRKLGVKLRDNQFKSSKLK